MATKHIYLISGLGADESIFGLLDFQKYQPHFIRWIEPLPSETLPEYAWRLSAQIVHERPILLGVSFGGMLATEIAKQLDCEVVLLVSSAKTRREIPRLYKLAGYLSLHKLIPANLLKHANFVTFWLFGMHTSGEKRLLKSILHRTDSQFLKWAIQAILNWKNVYATDRCVHLHGAKDRILPLVNIQKVDHVVSQGGHLMIYTQAKEVNTILKRYLMSQ